ncbi:hypothetical protein SAMN05443636_0011 [Halobaculum gomorrense]|uniref:Uncharacterized protein n=1 Tax=Halobaculum gomorrense TaxID=43928 RepID=A0A1M5J9R8_9EURY|nr:hypothetical protein SAMN05443636_0011 [Halobaculum gomorrense]
MLEVNLAAGTFQTKYLRSLMNIFEKYLRYEPYLQVG